MGAAQCCQAPVLVESESKGEGSDSPSDMPAMKQNDEQALDGCPVADRSSIADPKGETNAEPAPPAEKVEQVMEACPAQEMSSFNEEQTENKRETTTLAKGVMETSLKEEQTENKGEPPTLAEGVESTTTVAAADDGTASTPASEAEPKPKAKTKAKAKAKPKPKAEVKPKRAKFTHEQARAFVNYSIKKFEEPANKKRLTQAVADLKKKHPDELQFQAAAMNVLPAMAWEMVGAEMSKYNFHKNNMLVGLLQIYNFSLEDPSMKTKMDKFQAIIEGTL
eukprot:TRINITY_DN62366_c0_g1_i1.p1 TRINITY_DN62366_c0_g1~~TRINITY_DN62366_c0_g1_i1.p1  ORF type:complete len:279 (-),score=59.14 TRINITY_DN62366_c0_g1_i1:70-906(-)